MSEGSMMTRPQHNPPHKFQAYHIYMVFRSSDWISVHDGWTPGFGFLVYQMPSDKVHFWTQKVSI